MILPPLRRMGPAACVILAVIGLAVIAVILAAPVRRGPEFHIYADQRAWLGIPNAGDVLSNLPFVIVGLLGLRMRPRGLQALAFAGFIAIGFGSGAYHWHPCDGGLAFDFLPIVLTLAWLGGAVITDRIDRTLGWRIAAAGTAAALAGVLVWWAGGGTTPPGGDMRWYVATQALGVVLIAVAALLPAPTAATFHRGWVLAGVGGFLLARALSRLDHALLDATGISGHSWKHLVLGGAAACVLRATLAPRGGRRRGKDRDEP